MSFSLTHVHRLPDLVAFFDRVSFFRNGMRRRLVIVAIRGTIREERETTIGIRGLVTTSLGFLVLELYVVARG